MEATPEMAPVRRSSRLFTALFVTAVPVVLVAVDAAVATQGTRRPSVSLRPVLLGPSQLPPEGAGDQAATEAVASCDASRVAALPAVPTTSPAADVPSQCAVLPDFDHHEQRYYLGRSGLTGGAKDVRSMFESGNGWVVRVKLTKQAGKAFDDLARQQFHKQIALVVDGSVRTAPTIQPGQAMFTPFDGTYVISGDLSQREARQLALQIVAGSAPR